MPLDKSLCFPWTEKSWSVESWSVGGYQDSSKGFVERQFLVCAAYPFLKRQPLQKLEHPLQFIPRGVTLGFQVGLRSF